MGARFSRGALYLILQNRLCRGEIPHKGNSYPGEPPAIVDKPLWDDVQAVLAANRVDRATGARASNPSLLTGMVFDENVGGFPAPRRCHTATLPDRTSALSH